MNIDRMDIDRVNIDQSEWQQMRKRPVDHHVIVVGKTTQRVRAVPFREMSVVKFGTHGTWGEGR
ncbi:hypothetical protein [Ferrimicrobium sp.]|uniref:hypothetical protein n=1 Tax=Ferrimicrobium sp. TaxID=2926050 RepID=UPI002614055A|nr:hypothetical protein [Ferrimicrobium sp.]